MPNPTNNGCYGCGCKLNVSLRSKSYCARLGECDCHHPVKEERECICPPPKPYDWKHLEGCPKLNYSPKDESFERDKEFVSVHEGEEYIINSKMTTATGEVLSVPKQIKSFIQKAVEAEREKVRKIFCCKHQTTDPKNFCDDCISSLTKDEK